MAAKLPMTVRKNIRDSEPDRDKTMAEINKVCGRDMTFVPDFDTNFALFKGGRQERIGDIYHKELLPAILELLQKQLKEPLVKQAFDQTVTKNEIRIKIGAVNRDETKGQSSYIDVFFEDGALVLKHTPELSNVGDIARYNLGIVRGLHQSSSLPIIVRQNLEANKGKKDEAVAKISAATGNTWTFDEACMADVWAAYEKNPKWDRYKEQMGSFFYKEALPNLASNLEKLCKDDMVKEGFNEMFTGKTIVFRFVPNLPTYWVPACEGGKLIVQFKDLCNFGHLSNPKDFDIVKML
eukprot:Phypoly_transcript_07952.p1 GENE.Phypoly_transcript_07952~~Phypoly_transcript_07952.p1  ORF type:complete len:295 (+),score=60.85 Phypoly_transcript_07952:680-1564(+)